MKLKERWSYDRNFKQWWMIKGRPWQEVTYTIAKNKDKYLLVQDHFKQIGEFKKVINAKMVVDLILNG